MPDDDEPGLAPTVAPTSGLESTVAPPHRRDRLSSIAPTIGAGADDLGELPVVAATAYSIGPEIGRGGMGRVIAARDRRLRRDVVIKVLHHGAAVARFQREALITARLQHPSIVRVYDAGWLDGEQPFYAMERVRGTSLDRVVANAEDASARLALLPHVIAVADAIAYAHSEGVIHRDLKPHNVLVGSFGETVVIDWGLARESRSAAKADDVRSHESLEPRAPVAGADDQTVAGSVMGTPAFMPPEQARGEPADERSDVYAIGAILYSVLCGAPPVSGERALEDASAGSITPLREREPAVPPELASIVERAMAFSPAERYQSAKELADELRRFSTGQLVATHRYSTATLVRRWLRRHRTALAIASVATIVVVVLGVMYVRQLVAQRRTAEAHTRALAAQIERTNARSDEIAIEHATHLVASDPSQALGVLRSLTPAAMSSPRVQALANAAAAAGVGFELVGPTDDVEQLVLGKNATAFTGSDDGHLWGWSITSRRGDDLGAHTGPIEAIAISSNGLMLVTGGTDSTVRLWDLVTGQSKVLTGHTAAVRALAFAPDNLSFVSTSDDHTLRRWSIASDESKIAIHDTHSLRPIAWHPDGSRLWTGTRDGRVLELDVASGKVTATKVHTDEARVLALSPDGTHLASGGEDGAVFVMTLADRRLRKLATHADVVRDLVWTRDGAVISAGGDNRVLVTTLDGVQRVLAGSTSGIKDLALSPDGTLVAAAGIDHVARVWPVAGGEPRGFRGHRASVKAVALTADALITTSDDNTVRIWPLAAPPPAPLGAALAAWIDAHTNARVSRAP